MISGLDQYDYQRKVKCLAMNRLGDDSIEIQVGPLTTPDVPITIRAVNVSKSSIVLNWMAGFDGGADQIFEIRYRIYSENVYHTLNSTSSVSIILCCLL